MNDNQPPIEQNPDMLIDPTIPNPKWTTLKELFWGKKVAIVGNAPEENDRSEEIDSADIVVRINHAYNLPSNHVGKRTDILVITPTGYWTTLPDEINNTKLIQQHHPKIVSIKFHERLKWAKVQNVYKGCEFYAIPERDDSLTRFTTGTMLLIMVAEECEECEVKTYGFGTTEGFLKYIQRDGQHYLPNVEAEMAVRDYALQEITKLRMTRFGSVPYHVVIPARKGSSLKDKNIREYQGERLLDRCVRKCISVFGKGNVSVLTDSETYAQYAKEQGANIPFILKPIDGKHDVAETVQEWRDRTDFIGNVLVVLCTSPHLSEQTLRTFKLLATSVIPPKECYITATEVKEKVTSFLLIRKEDNTAVQLYPHTPMSTPRQVLPQAFRFTGAVALFPTSQLRGQQSFFSDAKLRIIPVPNKEALDIDDEEDMKK